MAIYLSFSLLICIILHHLSPTVSPSNDLRTYIIHMDKSKIPAPFQSHHSWYSSSLSSLSSPEGILPIHLYTYKHVINGFSAALMPSHVEQLKKIPGQVTTQEESFGHLHTTRTPRFLGLNHKTGLWPGSNYGDDMIIGIVDTGIWPESLSFHDEGMPPIPSRWRGACESGTAFNSSNCNKKLIGARSFNKGVSINSTTRDDYDSPRDYEGHGTHTSSTAAGSKVSVANHFGYANGTATGIAPRARLAMYKVLYRTQSDMAYATDTLAGIDKAIEDGVDLLSLSLGFSTSPFYENPTAIGTFAAMEKGIFVSCAAGNHGPRAYSILNGAPWITAVGAGTIDRSFSARVTFDDGEFQVVGKSVYPENLRVHRVPIYFGHGNRSKESCNSQSLNTIDVMGLYVFCDFEEGVTLDQQLNEVFRAGALGAICSSDLGPFLEPDDFYRPFVVINPSEGDSVMKYITRSGNTTVSVKFQVTLLGTKPAPQVADFSSRGPVLHAPWTLKPDILAPGVEILAAWQPNSGAARIRDDYLLADYVLASGTSMASPHIVGIAALLKSVHKDWSSAMIRSAMMSTADILDNTNNPIRDVTGVAGTPLDFGAGHVNPNKAMDPGLVYDIAVEDYINYMCALNYTSEQLHIVTGRVNISCENANLDLNYPSFIVILNNTYATSYTFRRELTNVVDAKCTYRAIVQASEGMKLSVQPSTIQFEGKFSKSAFYLTVEIDLGESPKSDYVGNYGFLTWYEDNGTHAVRSPVVSALAA